MFCGDLSRAVRTAQAGPHQEMAEAGEPRWEDSSSGGYSRHALGALSTGALQCGGHRETETETASGAGGETETETSCCLDPDPEVLWHLEATLQWLEPSKAPPGSR